MYFCLCRTQCQSTDHHFTAQDSKNLCPTSCSRNQQVQCTPMCGRTCAFLENVSLHSLQVKSSVVILEILRTLAFTDDPTAS